MSKETLSTNMTRLLAKASNDLVGVKKSEKKEKKEMKWENPKTYGLENFSFTF